ncbi:hypothetical protein Syun_025648 [Stephania yunnanensis]|uniref:Uncharacterized protein n=1 Tax=Stephania yunnanensis TaxID=152371 RepID=A0AAP0EZ72_9MAGN
MEMGLAVEKINDGKLIMTRMVQLNMGPKRLVRLTVSVLITLIHSSHYLVELNKSHGDSSLYRQAVTEAKLRESRHKHRPLVRPVIEERSKGLNAWKDTQRLTSKLYALKQDHGRVKSESSATKLSAMQRNGDAPLLESECADLEFYGSIKGIWL